MVKIGDVVIFVDSMGVQRDALVTWDASAKDHGGKAAINLVYVSGDAKEEDTYGRQIKRECSVVHKSDQPANGNYWVEK